MIIKLKHMYVLKCDKRSLCSIVTDETLRTTPLKYFCSASNALYIFRRTL